MNRCVLFIVLCVTALAAADDSSVVAVCHISPSSNNPQTQFRALTELPFHFAHGDCLGRCPCSNCGVAPDPLWTPCANATNPTCVLAPCIVTAPPPPSSNCSLLSCEACQATSDCAFCFEQAFGPKGACLNATEIGMASCARTGPTADLCFVGRPTDRIVPRAECFRLYALDTTARLVVWGYTSSFAETQTVPFNSSLNMINAPVAAQGVFAPGDGGWFFETVVPENTSVGWTLLDNFATSDGLVRECPVCAGADTCDRCQSRAGCGWDGAECVEMVRDASIAGYPVLQACPAADDCAARTDCQSCGIVEGCTWCSDTDRCVEETANCTESNRDPFQCDDGARIFVSNETLRGFRGALCRGALDINRPDLEYLWLVVAAFVVIMLFVAGPVLYRIS